MGEDLSNHLCGISSPPVALPDRLYAALLLPLEEVFSRKKKRQEPPNSPTFLSLPETACQLYRLISRGCNMAQAILMLPAITPFPPGIIQPALEA